MPQAWQSLFGENSGTAEFRRKFHCPTNLEPHECVVLVLTEVRGQGSIVLNNQRVGEFAGLGGSIEFEIKEKLCPFNQLVIEIAFDPAADSPLSGGLYGAVALDIRS